MEETKFQKVLLAKTKTITTLYSNREESLAKFIRKTILQLLNDYMDSINFRGKLYQFH